MPQTMRLFLAWLIALFFGTPDALADDEAETPSAAASLHFLLRDRVVTGMVVECFGMQWQFVRRPDRLRIAEWSCERQHQTRTRTSIPKKKWAPPKKEAASRGPPLAPFSLLSLLESENGTSDPTSSVRLVFSLRIVRRTRFVIDCAIQSGSSSYWHAGSVFCTGTKQK